MRYDTKPDLDLRAMSPKLHDQAVLAAFDHMKPGDPIVIDSSWPPLDVLHALQEQRPGRFDWAPVDHPPCWRIELTRREVGAGGPRVHDLLAWEHARLDEIMGLVLAAIRANDLPEARHHFVIFERRLNRHIHFEEELLFPEFEKRAGGDKGPTSVMRSEHREIRMMLERTARFLYGSVAEAQEACLALYDALAAHDLSEEATFYGRLDGLLSPAESGSLVSRIQEFA